VILVDQTTDASLSSDAVLLKIDGFGQRFQRCRRVQGAVRPVLVMVVLVLAQDLLQMGLVPDKGAIQELASASPIQRSAIAFMRGVRTLHSTVRIPVSARTASNAAVKFEPRSRIMNLTRPACSPRSMIRLRACWVVHAPVGVQRDAEDADAPGRVPDHDQDVGLGAVEQAGAEEVAGNVGHPRDENKGEPRAHDR
jgi:hypothetical protein